MAGFVCLNVRFFVMFSLHLFVFLVLFSQQAEPKFNLTYDSRFHASKMAYESLRKYARNLIGSSIGESKLYRASLTSIRSSSTNSSNFFFFLLSEIDDGHTASEEIIPDNAAPVQRHTKRRKLFDGEQGFVSVRSGKVSFALDFTHDTNLTLCYRFASEEFQHYPNAKVDVRFITKVASFTGSPEWAVVGVPERFSFKGHGVSNLDEVYWVEDSQPCTNNTSLRAAIEESSDGVVGVDSAGNATVTFKSNNAGKSYHICYKFENERPYRVDNHTVHVAELRHVRQSHGDLGVSVVEYAKGYQFLGEHLVSRDLFQWGIDGDCNSPPAEIIENGGASDVLQLDVSHPKHTNPRTTLSSVMNTTFTMKPSSSGLNLTLCYKHGHGEEPWTVYEQWTNDVRMLHNFSTSIGDLENSVANQPKHLVFHGHGLDSFADQAKFVLSGATTAAGCNDHSKNAVLTNADDSSNQHKEISAVGNKLGATFVFDPAAAGKVVHLCYKFDNEPFQVYTQLVNNVHHVSSIVSFQGGADYIVAHVKERIGIKGSLVTSSDFGRWVVGSSSTDTDCETPSKILLSDDLASNAIQVKDKEAVVVNATVISGSSHNGREMTFRFNSSYMGEEPVYCHKFKNEPFKIYPSIKTKIAHVSGVTSNVGDPNVAVVDYSKTFTFHGGHVTSADHVRWGFGNDCENLIKSHVKSMFGNTTVKLDSSRAASFNFTAANSGDKVTLCYKFNNEPYRAYSGAELGPEYLLDLRMVHNMSTNSGEWNRSVVDYPKPLFFHGHGLRTKDRAKFVISPSSFPDCNNMSVTAPIVDSNTHELEVDSSLSATFYFDEQASGHWIVLCYAFENEPYQVYFQQRSQVNMVKHLSALKGDTNVAVVDYPKTIFFSGDFLSEGDMFRWVDPASGDACDLTADIYNATPALPHLSHLKHRPRHVHPLNTTELLQETPIANFSTTTMNTFTMTPASSGRNNTLCYKHRSEPWKIYEHWTQDVRMIHGVSTGSGSHNVSVVDQDKFLTFHGPGQNATTDKVKWVKRLDSQHPSNVNYFLGNLGYVDGSAVRNFVEFDDCNNSTRTASLNNPFDASDQSMSPVGSVTTFNFHESSGGYILLLCYRFGDEPYQLYTEHKQQVHMVRNLTSYQGGADIIVAHVKERMSFHGDYITSLDTARWVVDRGSGGKDSDCHMQTLDTYSGDGKSVNYTYSEDEGLIFNSTNPESVYPVSNVQAWGPHKNSSHEATFLYNESYSGVNAVLCHKFKSEPYKIYNDIKVKIAHIEKITVNEGDIDIAVVGYRKNWTFHGGHLQASDRAKWVLSTTAGCDGGEVTLRDFNHTSSIATTATSEPVEYGTSSAFNFTDASKGTTLKLCYQFNNEPYRPYAEFPLEIKMAETSTASSGSVDQAVPFASKFFFYSGQGLSHFDTVKWAKWGEDCNGANIGASLYGGNVKKVAETSFKADGETSIPEDEEGAYAEATFIDRTSGKLKLCYKFVNEPFMQYYNLPVTVVGLSSITTLEGDSDIIVLDYRKKFQFNGFGVAEGDLAFWVKEGATRDEHCLQNSDGKSSIYLTPYTATVQSDLGGTFEISDPSYAGQSLILCYKFGLEEPKLYPEFSIKVKTLGHVLAVRGSNSSAVAYSTKTFLLSGGQVEAGDRIKWVEGIDNDAGCSGDSISGGMLNASVLLADYTVSFDFTSPSPDNSYFFLCYAFQNEPYKLYQGKALRVNALNLIDGMNETHAIMNTAQPIGFLGSGITDLDTVKFVSYHQSCDDPDAFGAGSGEGKVFRATSSVTFTEAEENLVLCYRFAEEPYARFEMYKLTSVAPEVQKSSVSVVVAGQKSTVKLVGSFGISFGDSIKFVSNAASNCQEGAMGEGPDNDARATTIFTPTNVTRSLDASQPSRGSSHFELETTEGYSIDMPLLLCYRFGPAPTNYSFFPLISLKSKEIIRILVDMSVLSQLGEMVEFTFDGFGIEDKDSAKFVDPGASVDADCGTFQNAGGSSEQSIEASKAVFQFKSGFTELVLCYRFADEGWKIYRGIEVIDTADAEEEQEEVFVEAPAEVVLSLEGSVDDIPENSPARAAFEVGFVTDISSALGIDQDRVNIIRIISGSIIVEFEIKVSANSAEPLVTELVQELTEQISDPNSKINSGNVTSAVKEPPQVVYKEVVEVDPSKSVSSSAVVVVEYQDSGIFNFDRSEYYTTEGSSSAKLTIVRSHGTFGDIVLTYSTVAGTAKAGKDYIHTDGSVTFLNGEREKVVEIPLIDDDVLEPHFETFDVYMRLDDDRTKVYYGSVGYNAVVGSLRNCTVRVYDWGEAGDEIASTVFSQSVLGNASISGDMRQWQVLGNQAEDLFMKEEESLWIDEHGLSSVDLRYSSSEYNDKCDYASPVKPCGYSCQYGDHAIANPATGEPSTVLQLDGNGYVVSLQPMVEEFGDSFTISLWVRGSSMSSAPEGTLFSYATNHSDISAEKGYHEILLSNHKDLSLLIKDRVVMAPNRYDGQAGGDRRGIKLGVHLNDDEWHFVVVTWRSADGRVICFLDGAKVFEGGPYKVGEKLEGGGSLMVGMAQDGPCKYDGSSLLASCALMEDTGLVGQVQNIILSHGFATQEVGTLMMRIPVAVSMDRVIVYWRFALSSATGRAIDDSSGQGTSSFRQGNRGYASEKGATLVVGTPKSYSPLYPCGEIYANIWHFHAGDSRFRGDISSAYGGRLQFKMMTHSYSGDVRNGRGSVVILGIDGKAISYKRVFGAPHENGGLGHFNFYSVVLREDHGWYSEPGGKLLTRAQFEEVLVQVDKILIRGDEYSYGKSGIGMEVVAINNVALYAKA